MATFLYYLKLYLRALSANDTLSIKELAVESVSGNARLREPLFCYAAAKGCMPLLLATVEQLYPKLYKEYNKILDMCNRDFSCFYQMLQNEDERIPIEYLKVYHSYRWYLYKPKYQRKTKEEHRKFILNSKKDYPELTNHKIYTELRLDPGNVNAYINHGDLRRVSVKTTDRIFEYVDAYAKAHNENSQGAGEV